MPKTKILKCKKHGECEHVESVDKKNKDIRYRCKKCRVEAVQRRRIKVKRLLVEYKGGECIRCGYKKCMGALSFHHTNPEQKDFNISYKGHTISLDRAKKEVDKCVLVCSNCHAEIHEELRNTK